MFILPVPAGTYFLADLLFDTAPLPFAALGLVAVVGTLGVLYYALLARDRSARNPLYGLLDVTPGVPPRSPSLGNHIYPDLEEPTPTA